MNIILKNSLRNIFGKPFRTLLIVISIFACAFCGYLCFDIGKTTQQLLGIDIKWSHNGRIPEYLTLVCGLFYNS